MSDAVEGVDLGSANGVVIDVGLTSRLRIENSETLYLVNQRVASLLFVLMSPLMLIGNLFTTRSWDKRKRGKLLARFDERLEYLVTPARGAEYVVWWMVRTPHRQPRVFALGLQGVSGMGTSQVHRECKGARFNERRPQRRRG